MAQTVSQAQAHIEAVLATASTWVSARRKSDGKAFFYIPGSNGAVYMTFEDGCTCPAAQRFDGLCKHSKAMAAHITQRMSPTPVRRPSVSLAPICAEAGCDDDAGRT